MQRVEFIQPKPRIEDWRVKFNGRTVGAVWLAGEYWIADVSTKCKTATKEEAFKAARKQAKSIAAASR